MKGSEETSWVPPPWCLGDCLVLTFKLSLKPLVARLQRNHDKPFGPWGFPLITHLWVTFLLKSLQLHSPELAATLPPDSSVRRLHVLSFHQVGGPYEFLKNLGFYSHQPNAISSAAMFFSFSRTKSCPSFKEQWNLFPIRETFIKQHQSFFVATFFSCLENHPYEAWSIFPYNPDNAVYSLSQPLLQLGYGHVT